ncbi:amidohydrolase family protein [Arthrobacter psychrochitiniphilus]|uniref:amidohydrolase family protein n=1 Tax=Arthrobacter psychrochitiniphilus TaxID=291045 RepID=UPI003F7B3753
MSSLDHTPTGASAPLKVDAHLHLWELAPGQYSWLEPAHGVLYNTYTAEQARDALDAAGIAQAILVQADDTAADTEAMLQIANQQDWITGVVGWLPLEQPQLAEKLLEKWLQNPKFCGVRTLIHNDPRENVLELSTVRQTLTLLAQAGLPFDVPDAFPRHLRHVEQLARALPELSIVIDHLGKPPRSSTPEQMALWESQLRAVAAAPNTVAKVSGLHAAGVPYSYQGLEQVWDVALSAFGPHRLMFGGDWPVSLMAGSYEQTVDVLAALIDSLEASQAHNIWAGTAQRVYGR